MNNNAKPLIFRVPCSKKSHALADKYAGQQLTTKKASSLSQYFSCTCRQEILKKLRL